MYMTGRQSLNSQRTTALFQLPLAYGQKLVLPLLYIYVKLEIEHDSIDFKKIVIHHYSVETLPLLEVHH